MSKKPTTPKNSKVNHSKPAAGAFKPDAPANAPVAAANAPVALGPQLAHIELFAHRFGEQVSYTFKGLPLQPGLCDGKGDGTSCGRGCICLAGQPTLLPEGGLDNFGIKLPE